jgi:hypothetical protein
MRKKKKGLTRAEHTQLARLAALPDDKIDTSDIPEAPNENRRRALPTPYRSIK